MDEHVGISTLTRKQVKLMNELSCAIIYDCNHSVSYNDFSILTCGKVFTRTEREPFNRSIPSASLYLFDRTSNKIFVRNLFVFNSSRILLIEWTFYYFVIFNCVGTTFRCNGIMQFTFVLVMRSNITWLVFQFFL